MNWNNSQIDLKDIWSRADKEDMYDDDVFMKFRDETVKVCRSYKRFPNRAQYHDIVEDMAIANDIDDFNDSFANLYDWADDNAIWIATTF